MKKSKVPIKSIFEQISSRVFLMTSLAEAKTFVTEFVNSKDINEHDKFYILQEVNNAKSLVKFQAYICNALLKYEGMGMNQINKTAKEAAAETAPE
jgi:hypothetical protein